MREPEHEQPEEPAPLPPRIRADPWHHNFRWVLFLFVAAVLGVAIYIGWRVVAAFLRWMKVIENF